MVSVISTVLNPFGVSPKEGLQKFNGVSKNFEWHLKECEWRWKQNIDDLENIYGCFCNKLYQSLC